MKRVKDAHTERNGHSPSRRSGWIVASAIGFATIGGSCAKAVFVNRDTPITCTVVRQECIAETATAGCATFAAPETLVGTTCFHPEIDGTMEQRCTQAFCKRPEANSWATYDYAGSCTVSAAAADLTALPKDGTCNPTPAGIGLSRVDFIPRSRVCTPFSNTSPACSSLAIDPPPPPAARCAYVDLSSTGAYAVAVVVPSSDRRDPITQILHVFPGVTTGCGAPSRGTSTFQLTAGQAGTASAAGSSTAITFTRGFASLEQRCDV